MSSNYSVILNWRYCWSSRHGFEMNLRRLRPTCTFITACHKARSSRIRSNLAFANSRIVLSTLSWFLILMAGISCVIITVAASEMSFSSRTISFSSRKSFNLKLLSFDSLDTRLKNPKLNLFDSTILWSSAFSSACLRIFWEKFLSSNSKAFWTSINAWRSLMSMLIFRPKYSHSDCFHPSVSLLNH